MKEANFNKNVNINNYHRYTNSSYTNEQLISIIEGYEKLMLEYQKTRVTPEPILISNIEEKKRFFNLLSKDEIIEIYFLIYSEYIKYFNLNIQNMQKECILVKDIINSISIWEFIQQKYFNSNKKLGLKK